MAFTGPLLSLIINKLLYLSKWSLLSNNIEFWFMPLNKLLFSLILQVTLVNAFASSKLFVIADPFQIDVSSTVQKRIDAESSNLTIKKFELVTVNIEILKSSQQLEIELFHGKFIYLNRFKFIPRNGDNFSWIGNVKKPDFGSATFSVVDSDLSGHINSSAGIYHLLYLGEDIYSLRELNTAALPKGAMPVEVKKSAHRADSSQGLSVNNVNVKVGYSGNDESIVDIVIVYTQAAKDAIGNIDAEVQGAIDNTNAAYEKSLVNHRVRLAHAELIAYTESGAAATDISRLTVKEDGQLESVHELRNLHCGDLLSLWVNTLDACGIANVITNHDDSAAETYGFSVVAASCAVSNYSFAHEIGHNFGSRHDPGVDPTNTPYAYSHGHFEDTVFRTIMAYDTLCTANNCPRVGIFSNPDITYGGFAGGVANTSNNARSLNNTASKVAKFRADTCSGVDLDNSDPDVDSLIGTDCFIATATYGTVYHPLVSNLRAFRDNVLIPFKWGKRFVSFYYQFSPPLAKMIKNYPILKSISLVLLTPIILLVTYPISSLGVIMTLAFLGMLLLLKKRRLSL